MEAIFFSMMMNSLIFYLVKSPLMMLLSLITQTFFICYSMKIIMNPTWLTMILFLIFVGGLMIMFMYITSLASNSLLPVTGKDSFMLAIVGVLLLLVTLRLSSESVVNFENSNLLSILTKIYSSMTPSLILGMMSYLLLVLLITIMILMIKSGPLRSLTSQTKPY